MLARLALLLAALAAPALAHAQYDPRRPPPPPPAYRGPDQRDQGLILAGRIGWGSPSGDISRSDYPLDDVVDRKIPFWLELGYRFNPRWWGDLYLELAPVTIDGAFCEGGGCDGSNVRFGVDVQLHLAPRETLDPWIGIGVGVEVLNIESLIDTDLDGFGDVLGDVSYSGWEFPVLQAGLDLAVSPRFAIGPFVSLSLARYTSQSVQLPGSATDSDQISDRAGHSWLEVGVKGTFKL